MLRRYIVRLSDLLLLRQLLRWLLAGLLRIAHQDDVVSTLIRHFQVVHPRFGRRVSDGLSRVQRIDSLDYDVWLNIHSAEDVLRCRAATKEPWTIEWIKNNSGAGKVLYDIGANVGAYSLIAAKEGGPQMRIVSFEPSAVTCGALCENIVLNHFQQQIIPVQAALSEKSSPAYFHYSSLTAGAALHKLSDSADSSTDDFVFKQPIYRHSLDAIVKDFELPMPTMVKIDVDGHEERLLLGAKATLGSTTVSTVLIEIDKESSLSDLVSKYFTELGFKESKRISRERAPDGNMPPDYVIYTK